MVNFLGLFYQNKKKIEKKIVHRELQTNRIFSHIDSTYLI